MTQNQQIAAGSGSPDAVGAVATQTLPSSNSTPDISASAEPTSNEAAEGNNAPNEEQTSPKEKRQNEAARYRTKLRYAEQLLGQHAATIETLEKQLVEHYSGLPKTEAIWAAGVSLDELRDEHGNISRELVAAADSRVRERFAIRSLPKPDPAQGRGGAATKAGFSDAFKLR